MGAHSAGAIVLADAQTALVNVYLTVLVLVARHTQAVIVIHSVLQQTQGEECTTARQRLRLLAIYLPRLRE